SKEQREGQDPDPRHDLYSLGVLWYQLLVGDVTREMGHGWAEELAEERGVPAAQVEMIKQCVGLFKRRPENAGKLLEMLRGLGGTGTTPPTEAAPSQSAVVEALPASLPEPSRPFTPGSERARRIRWDTRIRQLSQCHRQVALSLEKGGFALGVCVLGGLALGGFGGHLAGAGVYELFRIGGMNAQDSAIFGRLVGVLVGLAMLVGFLRLGFWLRRQ